MVGRKGVLNGKHKHLRKAYSGPFWYFVDITRSHKGLLPLTTDATCPMPVGGLAGQLMCKMFTKQIHSS